MIRCIALLRGINVGGRNKIIMSELRELFETLGLTDVRTYIQSGNIVFTCIFDTSSDSELEMLLEKEIKKKFKYDVPVIIRTDHQLEEIIKRNPFPPHKNLKPKYLNVVFQTLYKQNIINIYFNKLIVRFYKYISVLRGNRHKLSDRF